MDAELFQINETFEAFNREYKRGGKLRESDLANWSVTDAEQEREVAKLLVRGQIERIPAAPAPAKPIVIAEHVVLTEPVVTVEPKHEPKPAA